MEVVIIGGGGHGREMAALLQRMQGAGSPIQAMGFVDNKMELCGQTLQNLPVLGDLEWARNHIHDYAFVCAIGNPAARREVVRQLDPLRIKWVSLIDPDAPVPPDTILGTGCMVCAGTRMTTHIQIGRHAIVNLGCTLSHDLDLGDYATLACGVHLSGNVTIGEGAELGVGTNVIQGITIGEWSIIGAGATVIDDVPPRVTAVGVPAKVTKKHP